VTGKPVRKTPAGKQRGLSVVQGSAPGAVETAANDSRVELLRALRDRIASDIDDGVPARDLASLSKRLLDISKELEDLEAALDGDEITDAAATPDEAWSG
jgi:hypothetical protein